MLRVATAGSVDDGKSTLIGRLLYDSKSILADQLEHIAEEKLVLPSIYFAHERDVFKRDGMLYALSDHVELLPGEEPFTEWVRYRTVGDMSCTGAVRSRATSLEDVVAEIAATRVTERGETRADDRATEAAMEDRKREGYF